MGCDIHMYVERKTANGYESVPKPQTWNSRELVFGGDKPGWECDRWFSDRNYHLFSWLAGVRNSDENKPLSEPRGLPIDVGTEAKSASDEYGCDGHSHSFFTLSELSVAAKDEQLLYSGAIDEKSYLAWRESGEDFPDSWCASTSAQTVTEDDYKSVKVERNGRPLYVECAWKVPVSRSFARFFKFIDGAREVAGADCRLVFFFDN